MLKLGSAQVTVAGFSRVPAPPTNIHGYEAINLGRTHDGQLVDRVKSVAWLASHPKRLEKLIAGCDVVIARNLEMLVLAASGRRRYAPNAALVFECLDIHRLLLRPNLIGRLLRGIETKLVNDVDMILTSSPRFVSEYFVPRELDKKPIMVLENKLLLTDETPACPVRVQRPNGPPWRIGWFGMIRCQRSFEILRSVAREADGALQVVIAGRASPREFSDFDEMVADAPFVTFLGPYQYDQLAAMYGAVHFSWAVDYFEHGLNSSWLLPNRIYESSYFGAVPIASEGVETAKWLANKRIGMTLAGDPEAALRRMIGAMNDVHYRNLSDALQAIAPADLVETTQSCRELVETLANLKSHTN